MEKCKDKELAIKCLWSGLADEQSLPPKGSKGLHGKPGLVEIRIHLSHFFLHLYGVKASFSFLLGGAKATPDKDRIALFHQKNLSAVYCSVCMHTCECVCTWIGGYACLYMLVWKTEVDIKCLPLPFSIVFLFEAGSLTEAGVSY